MVAKVQITDKSHSDFISNKLENSTNKVNIFFNNSPYAKSLKIDL